MVQTKSSPFFGMALQIGALLGGASIETAKRLKELGNLYGEMIQVHDDLSDTLAVPATPTGYRGAHRCRSCSRNPSITQTVPALWNCARKPRIWAL